MHGDISYFNVADTGRRAGRGQIEEKKVARDKSTSQALTSEYIFLMLRSPHFYIEFRFVAGYVFGGRKCGIYFFMEIGVTTTTTRACVYHL